MVDDMERRRSVYKEVWGKLSKVDVSDHIETKMNLSYLSWAWAWGTLMEHYPEAEYYFSEEKFFPDGSCQVECIVDIRGCERKMWLPVMDHRNNAISNPSARQISDARMRCLVKVLAIFGLGHYIYAGEDTPQETTQLKDPPKKKAKKTNGKVKVSDEESGVHIAIRTFITECKDLSELVTYYKENETELDKLKKNNPEIHAACMSEFTKKKEELQSVRN
mgnify:CR=1 FL=1